MGDEMTIEDATNVENVLSDVLACDANKNAGALATTARQLVRHIGEQSSELERERSRRRIPGVRQEVVIAVPRDAHFAWPDELRR